MNIHAIRAIYFFEMHRWVRTIVQSVAAPVITTSLYFIVFGAAIGSTVYALPSNCVVMIVDGVTYNQCGSTWYQPSFEGTTTSYTVVNAP